MWIRVSFPIILPWWIFVSAGEQVCTFISQYLCYGHRSAIESVRFSLRWPCNEQSLKQMHFEKKTTSKFSLNEKVLILNLEKSVRSFKLSWVANLNKFYVSLKLTKMKR